MWARYAKDSEGVVIKSTAGALMRSLVQSLEKKWWIGKVSYIDLSTHDRMNVYEGHQAHLRAFLKEMKYSHEKELRVATMNFVAPGCLNPDGSPQSEKQRKGFIDASDRLAKNQKVLEADYDGGHATTLISRGIIVRYVQPGQVARGTSIPMTIPDHVWKVLVKHKARFEYEPPRAGEQESPPWRIHWMGR
jgi:hypothetical protein